MIGAGAYDDILTKVREETEATTAILIIMGGNKGAGFSMQSVAPDAPHSLPFILRKLADNIEAEVAGPHRRN